MVRKSFKWYAGGFWLPHIHLNRSYRDHLFRFLFKDKRELLEKCRRLEEYSEFVSRIHDALGRGMSLKHAIETAMDNCIEEGILKDVLIRQKTEVMHMLLTEFDEKKYKRSVYQDGYEDGVREGEISGFTKGEASGFTKGEASGLRKGQAQGREDALRDLARKKASQGKDVAIIAAELETDVETVERLLKEEC